MIEDILKEFTPYRIGDKFLYDEEDVRKIISMILLRPQKKNNYTGYTTLIEKRIKEQNETNY